MTELRSGKPAPSRRRRDIQGLRALAILLVVVYHAGGPIPGGFTGVDVFFVVSGFVITATLLRELESVGRIDLLRFYARRVKRLLPALALMVTIIAALSTLAAPLGALRITAVTGVFASLFSANVYLFQVRSGYFDLAATLNPFLHTWTLGVEEQFYIFFPTLLLVSWWLGRLLRGTGRRAAVVAVAVVSGVSFMLALALTGDVSGRKQQFAFYGSPTRAWEFGVGALVALFVPRLANLPRLSGQGLGALGFVAIGVGAFAIHGTSNFPRTASVLPVLGACALLAGGTASRGGAARILSTRPAVWIGDLSYSWYLWHWPLIVFAAALWPNSGWAPPTLAALSLIPAWLSYRYVENPIRFSSRISGRAVLALAATCVFVSIAACLGLAESREAFAVTSTFKSYERSQISHMDLQLGCDDVRPLGQRTAPACTIRVPESRGRVVLIGDSNAGHFSEPVVRAANRAGFDVSIVTLNGCPFVDLWKSVARRDLSSIPGASKDLCRRFYSGSLKALVRLRPSLVITAARTDNYFAQPSVGLGRSRDAITYLASAKARLWYQGLASTLRRLNDAGIPVVVAHPVPVQPVSASTCAVIRILTASCTISVSRTKVDESLRRAISAENRAIATVTTAWAIDFENQLCDRDRCEGMRGGTPLYRDRNHLSVDGALSLTDPFYKAIAAHARPAK